MTGNNQIIHQLLEGMRGLDASDLHVKVGIPPTFRIGGKLRPIQGDALTPEKAEQLVLPLIPERLKERLEKEGGVDFAYHLPASGERFRVNIFRCGGRTHAAIRRVKLEIPTYESLHLPPIYNQLIERTYEGLVIVCGVTGSGKSTTLAAMIEHINATRNVNIITIEDPVEYLLNPKKAIISQREIGIDVPNYPFALRYVVRQDPDVIFIGEMRDHETVLAAIQAAETGHLVFGSLHTADTMQSFNRILEFFPEEEHGFVRSALATSLKAVCAQRLLPAVPEFEVSRVPATEVLLNSPVVRDKIREGVDEDIPAIINASLPEGMRSFTYSLADMVKKEWVTLGTAMQYAPNQEALSSVIKGVDVKAQTLVHRVKSPRM
jgi:twitching motility protein PilT